MFLLKVLTFFLLLAGVCGNHFELSELITRIHKESDLTTVYFIGVDNDFLSDLMGMHLVIPVSIFTTLPSDYNDRFYNDGILVVQVGFQVQMLEEFILRLKVRKFVIISASSLQSLQQCFSFFMEKKFTRIFGKVNSISYAYLPYADNPIQELLKIGPLPNALEDLNGFTFRTNIKHSIPRTFWYKDNHGKWQIGGRCGQIYLNFLRKHNATFKDIFLYKSNDLIVPKIVNATVHNVIDISMNALYPRQELDYSYPIQYLSWTVLVPLNSYLDPNEYFLRPFSPTVWICIGLTLVYIILMDVIKDICTNTTTDVWGNFSRVYLAMLYLPAERPVATAYRFHGLVLLFAFVIGNLYVIYFTSFLTVFIKVKQYETIQDLIDYNVPVVFPYYEWQYAYNAGSYLAGFEKIVVAIDYPTYYARLNSDTRFAYALGEDKGKFLINLQQHYTKPVFHLTRDGIKDSFEVFLLPPHSPFKEILNSFIIRLMDTGLLIKWDRDAVPQSLKTGLKVNLDLTASAEMEPVPLTLRRLHFAWIFLAIGLSLAFVVFIGEVIARNVERIWKFCKK